MNRYLPLLLGVSALAVGPHCGPSGSPAATNAGRSSDGDPGAVVGAPGTLERSTRSLMERRSLPRLLVDQEGHLAPLPLAEVAIEVTIVGHLAATSSTLTFHNSGSREVQGALQVPIPAGSIVSEFALHGDRAIGQGAIVLRAARHSEVVWREPQAPLESAERSSGHVFQTEVPGIPARGTRTVQVGYVSSVAIDGRSGEYRLPLDCAKPVAKCSLVVHVHRNDMRPPIVRHGPAGVKFRSEGDQFVARAETSDLRSTGELVVGFSGIPEASVFVERASDGEVYFAIRQTVTTGGPTTGAPPTVQSEPDRLAIYWDASLSRAAGDHGRERAVLRAYLQRLTGPVKAELVFLGNAAPRPLRYVLPDERTDLMDAVRSVQYDGGTSFGGLGATRSLINADLNLVFSDGRSTFGPEESARLYAPTYVFHESEQANRRFLRDLASRSGGGYTDLREVAPEDAASAIGKPTLGSMRIEAHGVVENSMYARQPTAIGRGFQLVGMLRGEQATITVHRDRKAQASRPHAFRLRRSSANRGDLLRRHWAQQKLEQLLRLPRANQDEILAVAQRHTLAVPGTALVVPERLEQYLAYGIRPAAEQGEMRAAYDAHLAREERGQRQARAATLERVIARWQGHISGLHRRSQSPTDLPHQGATGETSPIAGPPGPAVPSLGLDAGRPVQVSPLGRRLQPWNPATPYLRALRAVSADRRFDTYLQERARHGAAPGFYLDVAEFFGAHGDLQRAVQVLSNLAELELEDPRLLEVMGHRLRQLGFFGLGLYYFEQALRQRPDEPRLQRVLALALAERARSRHSRPARRKADYARAMRLLANVVVSDGAGRDPIAVIALTELNHIIPKARQLGVVEVPIDSRLVQPLEMDLRVVMSWDVPSVDLDLQVLEPSQEVAHRGRQRTTMGGRLSGQRNGGTGPEVYSLQSAMKGRYVIEVRFPERSTSNLTGPVTLQVDIFTDYGRPEQKREIVVLRSTGQRGPIEVGEVVL